MRIMLLSFKAEVYERILSGEKIYEHRRVFPDGPVMAYLYVSAPVKAITGILYLDNKVQIESWKEKYSDDKVVLDRIEKYLLTQKVAMEIKEFRETNKISLEKLRSDLDKFIVPQMFYFIENSELLDYLKQNIVINGKHITHTFDNISSDMICVR